jgi:hypothetical protein
LLLSFFSCDADRETQGYTMSITLFDGIASSAWRGAQLAFT